MISIFRNTQSKLCSKAQAQNLLAYKSIRKIRTRAVDIIIGTEKRFEECRNMLSVEEEIMKKALLLGMIAILLAIPGK